MDALDELRELSKRIRREERTVEAYEGRTDEDGCFHSSHRQSLADCKRLAAWLGELLEIKEARVRCEVFMGAYDHFQDLMEEEGVEGEQSVGDRPSPIVCARCGSSNSIVERGNFLCCGNCGANIVITGET